MGMQISTEGTIGIALGLVGLAGAGAIMVFPQDIGIGWCLIAVAVIGFIWLAIAHFGLWHRPHVRSAKPPAQNGDIPPGTIVSLDGSCDFKIDGKNFECERKLAYGHFMNGRTQINVLPKVLGAVAFSGGKDLQLKPEHYFLTVDRLFLSGGTFVPADGFCSIHLQADGQIVYMVEGNALAHDGRVFEFKFTPDPTPPANLISKNSI
jgi:hypothetical protein